MDGSRELLRLDSHVPERSSEDDLVTDEMEPRRLRVLLARVNQRLAALVENAEVTDQRLQAGAKAGRCDHRVDVDARPI